ncbi:Broad-specificity phosphatase [Pseudozyma hubeiensis]|nr:Broad-specificity phosphatase [Pseudozyma hubeiensis]
MTSSDSPPPTKLRVLIVRHGETRENVERIIQGQLDTDLNARGRQQADITGQFLSSTQVDRIIASPLKRAADTAKAIHKYQRQSTRHQEPLQLELDDRLKERAFGVLEGKVYNGGSKKSEDTEGIERMEPFSERLASFWNDLVTRTVTGQLDDVPENTETVVLVSHGAAISALMNQVLVPGRYAIVPTDVTPARFWNCSITELLLPVIRTSESTLQPGHPSRKAQWSIRPIHLGVQGSQFILDHELQKKLLAHAKPSNTSSTQAIAELEALVNKTEQEFNRDPEGKKQLEEDTIKAPDGKTVEDDIGYGKAIGVVLQWSNVDHLKELEEAVQPVNNSGDASAGKSNVNVDELVK